MVGSNAPSVSCATAIAKRTASNRMSLTGPRLADARGELAQLTALVESRATGFNLAKPREGAIDAVAGCVADHIDGHDRAHQHLGADGHRAHFAFESASTTA